MGLKKFLHYIIVVIIILLVFLFISFLFLLISPMTQYPERVCNCSVLSQAKFQGKRLLTTDKPGQILINGNSSYVQITTRCGSGLQDVNGVVWSVTPSVSYNCTDVKVSIL